VRVPVYFLSLSDACHEAADFLRGFFFHARRDVREHRLGNIFSCGSWSSVGMAASEVFFLSSAICESLFRGMKKTCSQTARMIVTSTS